MVLTISLTYRKICFGMCGMHADGSKATGFKSKVVAQFTGIGLQKDDNAFILDSGTGRYNGKDSVIDLQNYLFISTKKQYLNQKTKISCKGI